MHESVSETAVIGIPHEIKGESAIAFTILKPGYDDSIAQEKIRGEMVNRVRNNLAKFAAPEKIYFVDGLPKTRSGKIMRRILRKICADETDAIGDISTLADPSVVEQIIKQGTYNIFYEISKHLMHIFYVFLKRAHEKVKSIAAIS